MVSPYNNIRAYDVDVCANNEEQAPVGPVKDVVVSSRTACTYEEAENITTDFEKVVGTATKSTILGRTNNPGGKDGMRSGLVVFNEIHQYQDYKNIEVFTTGLERNQYPRQSYYTTQGDIREGPLDDMLETRGSDILSMAFPDNGMLPFICKLDDKEEVHDERNWEKPIRPFHTFQP